MGQNSSKVSVERFRDAVFGAVLLRIAPDFDPNLPFEDLTNCTNSYCLPALDDHTPQSYWKYYGAPGPLGTQSKADAVIERYLENHLLEDKQAYGQFFNMVLERLYGLESFSQQAEDRVSDQSGGGSDNEESDHERASREQEDARTAEEERAREAEEEEEAEEEAEEDAGAERWTTVSRAESLSDAATNRTLDRVPFEQCEISEPATESLDLQLPRQKITKNKAQKLFDTADIRSIADPWALEADEEARRVEAEARKAEKAREAEEEARRAEAEAREAEEEARRAEEEVREAEAQRRAEEEARRAEEEEARRAEEEEARRAEETARAREAEEAARRAEEEEARRAEEEEARRAEEAARAREAEKAREAEEEAREAEEEARRAEEEAARVAEEEARKAEAEEAAREAEAKARKEEEARKEAEEEARKEEEARRAEEEARKEEEEARETETQLREEAAMVKESKRRAKEAATPGVAKVDVASRGEVEEIRRELRDISRELRETRSTPTASNPADDAAKENQSRVMHHQVARQAARAARKATREAKKEAAKEGAREVTVAKNYQSPQSYAEDLISLDSLNAASEFPPSEMEPVSSYNIYDYNEEELMSEF